MPFKICGEPKMTENHNLEKAVEYLAQNNFEVEDGLERIIWLRRGASDVIRLIEVNRNGFPTGRIEAFYFAPSEDVPFEAYLADITPKEWQQILSGEIPLPEGWSLEDSREFLRSEFEVEHVG
jgi:hypothetical protein